MASNVSHAAASYVADALPYVSDAFASNGPSYLLAAHPVVVVTIELATIAFVVGFTSSTSIIRLAALPIICTCVWLAVSDSLYCLQRTQWAAIVGINSFSYMLQYIEAALLTKWSFETRGPSPVSPRGKKTVSEVNGGFRKARDGTFWERLRFGINATVSHRYPDTPYEVKNVPHFSTRDPSFVPSKTAFLCKSATTVLVCYLIVDLASLGLQPERHAVLFSPEAIPLFKHGGRISTEDLLIRVVSTFGFWSILYFMLQALQNALAFIAVASGMNEVRSWRPAFGSLKDAYTVRNFWGVFWHQNLRQRLSEPANFITHDVLRLPNGGLIARYTFIFFSFLISGFMHAATDVASGVPWRESGSIKVFCTHVGGIMLEDAVKAIFRSARGPDRGRTHTPVWTRVLGYVWVIVFMAWSVPVWSYPAMYHNHGEKKDEVLPFSIVGFLRS
ncbi:MAG: hypothetical protein M1833_005225 [Piccolia ochrophora]|nr:MAG: hypothetical protein M1833_005225 [Piccolia ochrophora]